MRLPLIPTLILLLLALAVDFFIFRHLRRKGSPLWLRRAYIAVAVLTQGALIYAAVMPKKSGSDQALTVLMWILFVYLSCYVPKIVYALFVLLRAGLQRLFHRPMRPVEICGAVLGIAVFGLMWWGALVNRFHLDVRETDVSVPTLPAAFNGLRIVQISDIHTGTYGTDTTFLSRMVDRVNALEPDIILFTGDIVNRHSDELRPFTGVLSRLSAPLGVWGVMGNHDYGDYYNWENEGTHRADADSLKALETRAGIHMLNNSHVWLRAGNDSIALIGVENIGDPPFPVYGSIDEAYPDIADSHFKILLSHNPAHWCDSISDKPDANIALTLAGHTHAMQVELAGFSPAAWRYPAWGGLYTDSLGRHLYVNIGLGTVAMPARIGATPEITVINLNNR